MTCSGIILCGGRGRRAGGADKGWLDYGGEPLISRVLARLVPQVEQIVISANRNLQRYEALGHAVVSDELEGYQGPLAGIAAALPLCSHEHTVVVACDLPELPEDLADRLLPALAASDVAYAWDGRREQYLAAALKVRLGQSLDAYLASGARSVRGWYQQLNAARVDFSDRPDAFANINRPASAS